MVFVAHEPPLQAQDSLPQTPPLRLAGAGDLLIHVQQALQSPNSGLLVLQSGTTPLGQIRLSLGRLLWVNSEEHRWRRWQRLSQRFFPQVNWRAIAATLAISPTDPTNLWEYDLLAALLRQGHIPPTLASQLLEASLIESLVDLLLSPQPNLSIRSESLAAGTDSFCLANGLALLNQAQQQWQQWLDAGLGSYSPNLAPRIQNGDELQRLTSPQTYQALVNLLTGQQTLRDIASLTNQDLKLLTQTLAAYAQQGLIGLDPLADTPAPVALASTSANFVPSSANGTLDTLAPSPGAKQPLIVCIDDNAKVCEMMGKILQAAGYRYLSVLDSIEALPILLEHKPDLIFLDLVMPVASGYEVCSQIRRIAALKQTPIVILTGNDGIIDRIRSKSSGATDFISKPPEVSKVLSTVRRYVGVSQDF